ncbi:MAG: tetratricopeptide repeat protein [Patescibacteria group bacterium]|jgi:hypothetical protein
MKITKQQKKTIAQSYKESTVKELADRTGLSEVEVEQYLSKKGKEAKVERPKDELPSYTSLKDLVLILRMNLPFLLVLLVVIIAVFANSLKGAYVSDDIATYVDNKELANFDTVLKSQVKIQTLILYISYNTFGGNPIFLHSVSILTHYLVTVVAFVLLYMRFGKKPALIAATLFAVHPVVTEVVSWISGINYAYQSIKTLILLILFTLYRNSNNKKYLIAAVIYFLILNLMSVNPWSLVIPATIVAWDQFILQSKINFKKLLVFVPLLAVSVLIFMWKLMPVASDRVSMLYAHPEERSPYWLTFPYTVFMTFRLMIFPDKLTLYHEGEVLTPLFFTITRIFLVVMIFLIPYLIRKNRTIAGLILVIYASLIPALSPVQVAWFMAERYLYLGLAFFCLMLGFLFLYIEKKSNKKYVALILTILLFLAYSVRTMVRNVDWRSHKNLWFATYKVSPSSPKVHNNLGDIYTREGNYEMAIYHFKRSGEISPNFDAAHFNLGRTYYITRQIDLAKQKFMGALRVNPTLYQAYYMLGVIEFDAGNLDTAQAYFLKALEINPADPETLRAMQMLNSRQVQTTQPLAP